ncbi:survival protein sure-like phosphatase/nucleotidase [Roridomyces roridus]|uniref:Survival protein sure-like phosphatase/nucleotidase n=1 Tax=Roridomyces roridus TaxID=1738132 RepID=A0AAD7BUE4_9AGAR|nr:survival protein sure-like phosphatase/nucleotidase [Roridomyces roridus]
MRVLLTNDDGPPSEWSPYLFGFYKHLLQLGYDVKVVIPSAQKSWVGNSFRITEVTAGHFYYPTEPDGLTGETSETARPLKAGEVAEWILLDGTPSTCANVALHNLYQDIDLVISGPNLGRNTSSAFALSSGTLGAALSASLSNKRSIAVSYGTVHRPTPTTYFEPAHLLACRIIQHLCDNWGEDEGGLRGEVDLYNVNIPLVEGLLSEEGLQVHKTTMWRNTYGRLFKSVAASVTQTGSTHGPLAFKFSPSMEGLIHPDESMVPVGSDGYAMFKGWASVTPLRAGFAEPATNGEGGIFKMKL